MFRRSSIAIVSLCAVLVLQNEASAQGRRGNAVGQPVVVTLSGVVKSVDTTPAAGAPTVALLLDGGREVKLMLGPYRVLAGKDLDIRAGSRVTVQAFESLRFENTYAAVQITNQDTGSMLSLRDSNGLAGWPGRGFAGMGGVCQADAAARQSIEGVVQAVNMGPGQGIPGFTLAQPDGKVFAVIASPFAVLRDSGYRISVGDRMSAVVFPSVPHDGAYIAAELNNHTTGLSITLRDAQGFPLIFGRGRGAGRRGGWR